ncbi:MAG TPA: alkaline phosphatase D family protein [Saprospiraceae bacterium]|nr:alkaline phosphatase D family protein [Saprospiraceae bacterium]HMP22749.1 alkaline phosphatase D family protein [Saprospiraceae bacterium]
MRPVLFFLLFLLLNINTFAQKALLQAGPMVGYSQMLEVALWVQTKEPAKVQIAYWEQGSPAQRLLTDPLRTEKAAAFTAQLIADKVQPGKRYDYQLLINDKPVSFDYPTTFQTQTLWQWRNDAPDFKVALGSCTYVNDPPYDRPGTPYGGEYQIFTSIQKMRPDVMLWLGDNVYLREADWYSRTGIMHRYTHSRSLPELQPLLASAHHYAIWDDHDFGPNDSDRSFPMKETTLEAFRLFWANPTYGIHGQPGTTTHFQWNDIDFFLLDNRYHRNADLRLTGERAMLGKEQIEWLMDGLVNSRAPFKMIAIGGQVLSTSAVHENYIHFYPEERAYLLRRIEEENIKNVIFLTGDRHHTELDIYTNARGNMVYDLTVSPLTSGFARNVETDNKFRLEGTLVTQRNFGLLEFSGKREERQLTMRIFDVDGQELWQRNIASQP